MEKPEWMESLSCATHCSHCGKNLDEKRILSVYDHAPICMECKKKEEQRPDYEEVSKNMIRQCMVETELLYGDPGAYCFHHFHPFTC